MSYLVASLFYKIILLVFIFMLVKTLIILDLLKYFNRCK
jgi:hypothetical protein